MKKIIVMAALLLVCISSFAQTGKSIYNKYSSEKGVSAVYISPSMFKAIGKIPDFDLPGVGKDVDLSRIIKTMDGFYLLDCDNMTVASKLQTDVKDFVQKGKYEMLMEVKDDGEIVKIYTFGDNTTITSFVLTETEDDEYMFLCIDGQMPREDLIKMIPKKF